MLWSPKNILTALKYFFIFFLAFTLLTISFLKNTAPTDAKVVSFYPTICLGGWKNTDAATGPPDLIAENNTGYNDTNSASVANAVAQIFCGGFKGEMPQDTIQKKVVLKFSWGTEQEFFQETNNEFNPNSPVQEDLNTYFVATATPATLQTEPSLKQKSDTDQDQNAEIITDLPTIDVNAEPEKTIKPELIPTIPNLTPEIEPALKEQNNEQTSTEEISLGQKLFFSVANAKEETAEDTENSEIVSDIIIIEEKTEVLGTTTEMALPSTLEESSVAPPAGAILEVRYTLDGEKWESLGYVSEINNEINFEMPLDIFSSIADLERVQISLNTIISLDTLPKIYLDSMRLEVEYEDIPANNSSPSQTEPENYNILSMIKQNGMTVLLILKNSTNEEEPKKMELWLATADKPITEPLAVTENSPSLEINTSSTNLVVEPLAENESEIYSKTALTKNWLRIADDLLLANEPFVQLIDNKIFWFGKDKENIWRFDLLTGAYDSASLSSADPTIMFFLNQAGGGPVISVRQFQKNIFLDPKATHSCAPKIFRIDITGQEKTAARLTLTKTDPDTPYEIEIGSLPRGIDIKFIKNNDYLYLPDMNDTELDLEITDKTDSQKGDFNIPFIYTKKGITDSSVICQINIVNQ